MKKIIATIVLALAISPVSANDVYKHIKVSNAPSGNGVGTVKVEGIAVVDNGRIAATAYCNGEYMGNDFTWIKAGSQFRLWFDGQCDGKFSLETTLTDVE